MLMFIVQYDVKHIITSQIKTITSFFRASTDIITNYPARPIELAKILAIMSILTFKIVVILNICHKDVDIWLYNCEIYFIFL